MTTRLDRLFVLLESCSSKSVRQSAANQLGEVAKAYPQDVPHLLDKLLGLLQYRNWDTRIAVGTAVGAVISQSVNTVWDSEQKSDTVQKNDWLCFEDLDLEQVLASGAKLLSTDEKTLDESHVRDLDRKDLNKRLGLDDNVTGHIGGSEGLGVAEDDLKFRTTGKVYSKMTVMEAVEGSRRKRRLSSSSEVIADVKVPRLQIKTEVEQQWKFAAFHARVLELLWHTSWEVRHGAATVLRELFRVCPSDALLRDAGSAALEDTAVRLLCILALDQLSDFVSDEVIAPVRETGAQALGVLAGVLSEDKVFDILQALLTLSRQSDWMIAHGGLLGIKYVLATRLGQPIGLKMLDLVFESVVEHLAKSPDDDVRASAASALLPAVDLLAIELPQQLATLRTTLWGLLHQLEELSPATSAVLTLLAAVEGCGRLPSTEQRRDMSQYQCLFSFLYHYLKTVRRSAVHTVASVLLEEAEKESCSADQEIVFSGLQQLYQRAVLEEDTELVELVKEKWGLVIHAAGGEILTNSCLVRLDIWLCLALQPDAQPLEETQWLVLPKRPNQQTHQQQTSPGKGKKQAELLLAGGRGGADASRESVCLSTRLLLAELLGDLLAQALLAGPAAKPVSGLLGLHLESRAALPRLVAAAVVIEIAGRAADRLSDDKELRKRVESALNDVVYYEEILGPFRVMQRECKQLAADMRNAKMTLDSVYTSGEVLSMDQCQKLVNQSVSLEQLAAAKTATQRCVQLQTQFNGRVLAFVACAAVALGWVGEKLNPVIRPLMDSVRREQFPSVRRKTAQGLAALLMLCRAELRPLATSPEAKVVGNLIRYATTDCLAALRACAETTSAEEEVVLTLLEEERLVASANTRGRSSASAVEPPPETSETAGAQSALQELCKAGASDLMTRFPALWSSLVNKVADGLATEEVEGEESLLQVLKLVEICAGSVEKSCLLEMVKKLVLSEKGLSNCAVLGGSALLRSFVARCLSSLGAAGAAADAVAVQGKEQVLPRLMCHLLRCAVPLLEDPLTESRVRCGVAEILLCIITRLELHVLPYLVLLLLPLLRRMGDQCTAVRQACSQAFGLLLRLLPLESSAKDPADFPEELSASRQSHRLLVEQLARPGSAAATPLPIRLIDKEATLRPYQQEGIAWLGFLAKHGLHGVLCDDLGLGKTLQATCALAASHYQLRQKDTATKVQSLVVCPSTLAGHWVYEVQKFVGKEDLRPLLYTGTPDRRTALQRKVKKFSLIVASYEIVRNDIAFFKNIKFNYVVLDEGHVIRNSKSKLSSALKQLSCAHRLVLTGTPIQNNVRELWSLFDFLMPGFLGSELQFNARFAKPIAASRDPKATDSEQERGALAVETLHRQVLPFMLRRLKEEVLQDLPPKILQDYPCELSPLQLKLYAGFAESQAAREARSEVDSGDGNGDGGEAAPPQQHVFQALHYLRRVCNHPALALTKEHPDFHQLTKGLHKELSDASHSGKFMALKQLLSDMGLGRDSNAATASNSGDSEQVSVLGQHRALLFAQSKTMLDLVEAQVLRPLAGSVTWLRLDGSVPVNQRHDLVMRFNSDPSIDLLLLTTPVGGLGLNLTGADTVIFLEHDWNPMKDLQAMDRAHRIGQKRVVHVYRLITRDTVEEKIMNLQRFKLSVANTVVSSENSSVDSLGAHQILDLFEPPGASSSSSSASSGAAESGASKKTGMKSVLEGLGELWESREYDEEYNLGDFVQKLNKK